MGQGLENPGRMEEEGRDKVYIPPSPKGVEKVSPKGSPFQISSPPCHKIHSSKFTSLGRALPSAMQITPEVRVLLADTGII